MSIKKFTKQPNDVLDYDFDFSDWLVSGDEIEAITITPATGITVDSSTFTSEIVKVWLSGGTDGETYLVTCLVETEGGRFKEKELKLKIKEEA